ncbi:MAG: class I SAM-dependent methyltransferase [Bacteroidales bacterium]
MKAKTLIMDMLRSLRLLQALDRARFLLMKIRNRKRNREFVRNHPDVALPPDYLMYESFKLDYGRYYLNGRKSAAWLADLAGKHTDLSRARILDWGCGPARVVRHLPDLLPGSECYGTDYNRKTITWCSGAFDNITFHANDLMPGLVFNDDHFDLVYGISIFTHLSEEAHHAWLAELLRVLKPAGVLFLTLHGASFREKLSGRERADFDAGKLVVRGRVREGHRTYTSFHPESWVRNWFPPASVAEHLAGGEGDQDVWIIKKPAEQYLRQQG